MRLDLLGVFLGKVIDLFGVSIENRHVFSTLPVVLDNISGFSNSARL